MAYYLYINGFSYLACRKVESFEAGKELALSWLKDNTEFIGNGWEVEECIDEWWDIDFGIECLPNRGEFFHTKSEQYIKRILVMQDDYEYKENREF